VLARETAIPLVGYAKFGPGVALWSSSNGRGTSYGVDGLSGKGSSFGLVLGLGGMLLLNPLQPGASRTLSNNAGIKRTYLFGEFTMMNLDGFGKSTSMNVGDRTWNVGLAFEI